MDDRPLRLLIADDEPLAAERLQLLLAQSPQVDLVGTASDGEAAVRLAEGLGVTLSQLVEGQESDHDPGPLPGWEQRLYLS